MSKNIYMEDVGEIALELSDYLKAQYGDALNKEGIDMDADEHFVKLRNKIEDLLDEFTEGEYQNYN